jgi:hypothetical protein
MVFNLTTKEQVDTLINDAQWTLLDTGDTNVKILEHCCFRGTSDGFATIGGTTYHYHRAAAAICLTDFSQRPGWVCRIDSSRIISWYFMNYKPHIDGISVGMDASHKMDSWIFRSLLEKIHERMIEKENKYRATYQEYEAALVSA